MRQTLRALIEMYDYERNEKNKIIYDCFNFQKGIISYDSHKSKRLISNKY